MSLVSHDILVGWIKFVLYYITMLVPPLEGQRNPLSWGQLFSWIELAWRALDTFFLRFLIYIIFVMVPCVEGEGGHWMCWQLTIQMMLTITMMIKRKKGLPLLGFEPMPTASQYAKLSIHPHSHGHRLSYGQLYG